MKKNNCTAFIQILNTLRERGISTKDELMADPDLYTKFWFVLLNFCQFALHSKTSKNEKGEFVSGNTGKIEVLMSRGIITRDEIASDCAIRIIEKLDLALRQESVEKQKNYCYKTCNNVVNDYFPKNAPKHMQIVSLNGPIDVTDPEDTCTYEDIIGDYTYEPQRMHEEKATVRMLQKQLKAKIRKEQAEKRAAILREAASLSERPAELFVRLAVVYLGMKPRELAALILEKGCESAYAHIVVELARKTRIRPEELRSVIQNFALTAKSVKADTNEVRAVAGQISRLIYRAEKRLTK